MLAGESDVKSKTVIFDTCLASLDQQTLLGTSFEVLVADNGSALRPDDVIARPLRSRLLTRSGPQHWRRARGW
jgi:glycosyltransferase involved in cell wall biosynthesis